LSSLGFFSTDSAVGHNRDSQPLPLFNWETAEDLFSPFTHAIVVFFGILRVLTFLSLYIINKYILLSCCCFFLFI
jgi:hypothetical protein